MNLIRAIVAAAILVAMGAYFANQGYTFFDAARSAVHEIEGLVFYVCSTVSFTGALLILGLWRPGPEKEEDAGTE